MATITTEAYQSTTRDFADLLKNLFRPLTQDEHGHLDEYMSFKNHDKSAKDASFTDTVKEVIADFNYYLGFKRGKKTK